MESGRLSNRKKCNRPELIMKKIRAILKHPLTLRSFRWILGGMFIYASLHKIVETELFARDIQNYKLVPYALTNLMAMILPWLELICGLFLISGTFLRSSTVIIVGLLSVFIIAIVLSLLRGINLHCGCYELAGDLQIQNAAKIKLEMIGHVFENMILLVMAFAVTQFGESGVTQTASLQTDQTGKSSRSR